MSITDTINKLKKAYPTSNKVNHVNITFVIPVLYLNQNKNIDYITRDITFEYDSQSFGIINSKLLLAANNFFK